MKGNVSLSDRSLPAMQDAEKTQTNKFSTLLAGTFANHVVYLTMTLGLQDIRRFL